MQPPISEYSALHLIKPCLKKQLWVMQSKVVGTDFFISLRVQNIPDNKATLPVLASVCTIHSGATFTRKSCEFSYVSVIIWVIISLNELHIVLEKFNPLITL